jgi:hypothetical protein
MSFFKDAKDYDQKLSGLITTSHIKGRKVPDETRAKLRAANLGKKHTEKTKAKIRVARAKQVISDETRAKISEAGKGRVYSKESRAKISAALGDKCHTPDGIFCSYVQAAKHYGVNQETVRKRVLNTRERWSDWYLIK